MKKRIVAIVLFVAMLLGNSPLDFAVPAFADASGSCGDNLTWSYNQYSNVLTISGTGLMDYFGKFIEGGIWKSSAPWGIYLEDILSVIIQDGVSSISEAAFSGCKNLTDVVISDTVTSIGPMAFNQCYRLTNINIPYGVSVLGYRVFYGCARLNNLSIPNSVTSIGDNAFYNNGFKSFEIPNSVTTIGSHAFEFCRQLETIVIPSSVTSIGSSAFLNAYYIKDVYYYGNENQWNDIFIDELKYYEHLHYYVEVPEQLGTCMTNGTSAYSFWSDTNPIEYIVEPVETGVIPTNHSSLITVKDNEHLPSCLIDGSYDNLSLCSACGEEISRETIIVPAAGHSPSESIKENEILPTCTDHGSYDDVVYCSACDEELSRETVIVSATGHKIKTITVSPTCSDVGYTNYICENCGNSIGETTILPATGHVPADAVKENEITTTCTENGSYDTVVYCSVCGDELSRETITVNAKGHNPSGAVTENEVKATCTESGSYDSVIYCSVCGDELSRETFTENASGHSFTNYVSNNDATCLQDGTKTAKCDNCEETDTIADEGSALGHALIHHTGKASTCKEKGYADYDTCSRCDYTTYSELPLADHVSATAVKENIIAATCTEDGSYDSVIYCSVCEEELSREKQIEKALGHNIIHHTGKPSTCKEKGYADYDTCSRCDYTTYSELPLAEHIPATAVKENTVAATCTENGSYDSVVYCSVCGKELSRKTETTVKTGHKDKNNDGVCDICGTVTDTAKHNAYLLGKAKINVKSSATVDYRSTVTVTATASGLPEGYVLAVYEGSTLKAKGSATSVSYNAGELMGNKTFTVKVVNSGNTPQKDSSGKEVNKTVEVKVKSGFFDKLIAFFRNLFGSLPKVEIKP